jgi:hypothetical protein
MSSQKYSVNQHLIETLLSGVKSGEIAIPEIQSVAADEFLTQAPTLC